MKLSIITSIYRAEHFLPRFMRELRSVYAELSRKNIPFEFIIIANDATPRETELIKKLCIGRPMIRYSNVARESLYATWNRGIARASGNVFTFWNVDDTRFAKALIEGMQHIASGAALVYFSNIVLWSLPLKKLAIPVRIRLSSPPRRFDRKEFTRSMFCGPFFMFTKALYEKTGPFDEQFKIAGDFDWCIRAAVTSKAFVWGRSIAGIFRVNGKGLSSGYTPRHKAENNVIYTRHGVAEKIIPGLGTLMSEYHPGKISCAGRSRTIAVPRSKKRKARTR